MGTNMILAVIGLVVGFGFVVAAITEGHLSAGVGEVTRGTRAIMTRKNTYLFSAIIGICLLWWLLYRSDIGVSQLAEWMWQHLLFSLVLTGIGIGIVEYFFPNKWKWVAGVFAVLLLTHWVSDIQHQGHHTARAQTIATTVPVSLILPPNSESEPIPVKSHLNITVTEGDGNVIGHCVYGDNHEETFVVNHGSCPDGNIPSIYLVNTSKDKAVIALRTW